MTADSPRRVADGTLVSVDLPPMRMGVDRSLAFVASTELDIKGLARAERHYFAESPDGRVRRMLVVQFEGWLPSNQETYRYSLPDPVRMGGDVWGSWVSCWSLAGGTAPETADTTAVLARHGLALDDELITARFARIVGEDARHEVLVFYTEPVRALGHSLASLATDRGELRPAHASVGVDLKARARRAFEIDA